MHGYYSETQAKLFGYVQYKNTEGKIVFVTEVCASGSI